jgi:MoaA/NifB/PqqE/SkfB family radical SAM enzyme
MVLEEGGPGFCVLSITPICNASCGFCGFSRDVYNREDGGHMPLERAFEAIDVLYRHGVRYLVLSGGEPLLHPDLLAIIRRARQLDMNVMLVTNGGLLSEKRIKELAEADLTGMVISVDAADVASHEENRGLPGVCAKIREANDLAARYKISSTASVTMSRLVEYEQMPAFLTSLGFQWVTFSYPCRQLGSSNLAQTGNSLMDFSDDELIVEFDKVKKLKKQMRVLNPTRSLEEMQRFLRNEPQRYPCLGGFRYFYVDWDSNLWRCQYWHEPICKVADFDASKTVRDGCTLCMIDCYRDSSLLHHIGISLHDSWQELKRGRPVNAVRKLATRANRDSLLSVLEDFFWIMKV